MSVHCNDKSGAKSAVQPSVSTVTLFVRKTTTCCRVLIRQGKLFFFSQIFCGTKPGAVSDNLISYWCCMELHQYSWCNAPSLHRHCAISKAHHCIAELPLKCTWPYIRSLSLYVTFKKDCHSGKSVPVHDWKTNSAKTTDLEKQVSCLPSFSKAVILVLFFNPVAFKSTTCWTSWRPPDVWIRALRNATYLESWSCSK